MKISDCFFTCSTFIAYIKVNRPNFPSKALTNHFAFAIIIGHLSGCGSVWGVFANAAGGGCSERKRVAVTWRLASEPRERRQSLSHNRKSAWQLVTKIIYNSISGCGSVWGVFANAAGGGCSERKRVAVTWRLASKPRERRQSLSHNRKSAWQFVTKIINNSISGCGSVW